MHDDPGFFSWLLDHLWAVVLALVGVVWRQNENAMKALKTEASEALELQRRENQREHTAMNSELEIQRGHIAKLFDKLEANAQRAEDHHRELLMAMNKWMGKADK